MSNGNGHEHGHGHVQGREDRVMYALSMSVYPSFGGGGDVGENQANSKNQGRGVRLLVESTFLSPPTPLTAIRVLTKTA
jgi:hypothetical protein